MVDMQSNDGEQQSTIFPAKNSHHSPKSTYNEKNRTINLRMFLCGLNEKKSLSAQSI